MNHLIACQPTSLRAIRLQTLVPPRAKATQFDDVLDKLEVKMSDILYAIASLIDYTYIRIKYDYEYLRNIFHSYIISESSSRKHN